MSIHKLHKYCLFYIAAIIYFVYLHFLLISLQFDYGPQMAGIILSLACLSFVITVVIWAQVIRLIVSVNLLLWKVTRLILLFLYNCQNTSEGSTLCL